MARVGVRRAVKRLEDALALVLGDPRPAVDDADHQPGADEPRAHRHRDGRRCGARRSRARWRTPARAARRRRAAAAGRNRSRTASSPATPADSAAATQHLVERRPLGPRLRPAGLQLATGRAACRRASRGVRPRRRSPALRSRRSSSVSDARAERVAGGQDRGQRRAQIVRDRAQQRGLEVVAAAQRRGLDGLVLERVALRARSRSVPRATARPARVIRCATSGSSRAGTSSVAICSPLGAQRDRLAAAVALRSAEHERERRRRRAPPRHAATPAGSAAAVSLRASSARASAAARSASRRPRSAS